MFSFNEPIIQAIIIGVATYYMILQMQPAFLIDPATGKYKYDPMLVGAVAAGGCLAWNYYQGNDLGISALTSMPSMAADAQLVGDAGQSMGAEFSATARAGMSAQDTFFE